MAVYLEKNSGKRPRIFCESDFLQKLAPDSRSKFRQIEIEGESRHELLWPTFHFENPGNTKGAVSEFCELFHPAASLWRHFQDDPIVEPQYFEFIRLIIRSTLHFFGNDKTVRDDIEREIRDFDLDYKKSELLN